MIFAAGATGKNDLLRFVATLLLVFLGLAVGHLPIQLLLDPESISSGISGDDSIWYFGLILLGFVGGFVGLWLAVRYLHRRSPMTLVHGSDGLDWGRLGWSFGLWMGLMMMAELVMYAISPASYSWQFSWPSFGLLLLVSVVLLPFQTSMEELIFRGYLLQQLGLLFRSKWVVLVVTSVLFGMMHGSNPEVAKFGLVPMMSYYIGFGLLLATIVILDGRLEIPLGMHAANNFFGATMVSFDGSVLETPTLFFQSELNLPLMLTLFGVASIFFLGACYQRYGWTISKLKNDRIIIHNEG